MHLLSHVLTDMGSSLRAFCIIEYRMANSWDASLSRLQQPNGCDFSLDACSIPGFTALARSDVELFRQVISMFFTICGLLASNADIVVTDLFSRWSEDARMILMSSEVQEHRQPL